MQQVSSINATQYNPYNSGGPGNLFLDHTGKTLYHGDIYAQGTGDNAYRFFTVESGGALNYLGLSADYGAMQGPPLSLIENNLYAYTANNYEFSPAILGYKRNQDGSLIELGISPKYPGAPGGVQYLPTLRRRTRLIIWRFRCRPTRICKRRAATACRVRCRRHRQSDHAKHSGEYATNCGWHRLQHGDVALGEIPRCRRNGGLAGVHFNGSQPITNYTGLLVKNEVDQMFWDNANHLYAISRTGASSTCLRLRRGVTHKLPDRRIR